MNILQVNNLLIFKKFKKMKTKIFIALFTIITMVSCNNAGRNTETTEEHEHNKEGVVELSKKQERALNLELGTVQERNLTTVVRINGQLSVSPSNSANISAIIGGNIKEIKVFEGDKVKKGQVLVVLEHPDYITLQEDFAVIAHKLEYLEQDYKRQKELYEKNAGSAKEYQKAKSEFNTAKARYESLKSRLQLLNLSSEKVKQGKISNTISLLSPINGFVNEINIKVGTYVDSKDVIMEITDNNDIHADFQVYEKDIHLVKKGQTIHFTVSNNPETEYTATIFAIGKEFDSNSRAITIHASIDNKFDNLIPGMYITGHFHADNKHTEALPNEAIVKKGVKSYVFVLDNDDEKTDKDRFKMTEVITGTSDAGYTEVHFVDELPKDAKIVTNVAYYLMAEMGKEETGDDD